MPNKIPATVRILTLQSAKTLRRALESVKDFEEILIFDGNSTDDTLKIAREYGARIEKQYPERNDSNILIGDWSEVVNRVLKAATHDWIFYIDSDETASPGLIQEIRNIVLNPIPKHYIYLVPNKLIYKDRIIEHAISYPGYQPRLFNRKCDAYYTDTPHYRLVYDKTKYPPATTGNPWYVYIDDNDIKPKRSFLILTAMKDKDQTWWQFLRWSTWHKLFGIVKIIVRAAFMYLRHGFKNTIPPKFIWSKILETWLLFLYLVKQRFIGPLKAHTVPPDKYTN